MLISGLAFENTFVPQHPAHPEVLRKCTIQIYLLTWRCGIVQLTAVSYVIFITHFCCHFVTVIKVSFNYRTLFIFVIFYY